MQNIKRNKPNILVTGTPGVGKSLLCVKLAEITGMRWIDVSKVAVENNCLEEFDQEYNCPILDEDKLMDGLEESMSLGGNIVDYHSCEFFPERWFDIVFVLRVDNTTLFDRLTARGYSGKKLEDNIQCEIFQTILEEARSSYAEEIVHELQSTNAAELESNVQRIYMWVQSWLQTNTET
ncbi:adenylate kinase isoenzyme 6-like [Atheta coriaria]|uniref:adenylate kinase isoenzyme 6-like n=1 Tax=Dalotia coriaria TaxID=877792 RepID=UPI0031F394AA